MKTYQLEGTPREAVGKKAAKAIRKESSIPAILYGSEVVALPYEGKLGKGQKLIESHNGNGIIVTHFTVTKEAIRNLIYTPEVFLVELSLEGGKKAMAMVKDIQTQPVTDEILHIDFLEIFDNKPIVIEVPVKLEGHSEGVKAGGKLSLEMRKLKVKALYKDIPEKLLVDITNLGLGKTIQVGSLHFDKLELVNAKNAVVAAVKLTRAARGAAAAAAAGK
ncbi:large subunit ribosomal protein L25 [Parabacteroides sp. PF5-5]|uniref:50S ribosomal protein L25/general stress protein Ctc n=1 Tax=unclassified Parabacteroides TaxID=2649774 RepID=UPI0024741827|nr:MULTISPECIES: 50S ribosomal protein L25/general stress protein Ctc [unclassified Parabacteroides]MDH6306586.1 large subunit ribosomal protein L25 [Parabacteroides sp. PH5-39]MDH6317553.1 large subunit ribosomal protein L25 [Parabacteroides sp. PF5-13]MDH6321297.1 large subunit ribosomal protein L25 [Parabacteroides sp. PH5-13]MDH6325029.1 large subunit ribosomal protein L25 [Parabacteroides sp. PH5-8]MDH6328738.1 large subunit ribosomal protein L25 [Parabacteroides sp. PH5-41]